MRTLSLSKLIFVGMIGASPLAGMAQNGTAPPFAQGASMTSEQALKSAPKMDPALAPLAKSYASAQASYKKKPRDGKTKMAYVDATYRYGHAVMMDRGKMPPPIQYRAALALYRKALAVDPKHGPSLAEKKSIEDVYRSMGRPVPK